MKVSLTPFFRCRSPATYALLKVAGKDAALKAARKELSARYARRRAVKEELAEA